MAKTKADRATVASAASMTLQVFRLHCSARHPDLGFWSKGEHAADHRLRAEHLDHTHEEDK